MKRDFSNVNPEMMSISDIRKESYYQGASDAIDEFAEFLNMSYDKGMRLSMAMSKSDIERFKIKAMYSQFIDAIPDCVKEFKEMKHIKENI